MGKSTIKTKTSIRKLYHSGTMAGPYHGYYYYDFDISSDMASYGDPIDVEPYVEYNCPVNFSLAGLNTVRVFTPVEGITCYAYVTYSKDVKQIN